MQVAATVCWLVAFVGLTMVVGAVISRTMKRLLRLSDETVNDPWFRRTDTSGLSLGIQWMRPGLITLAIGTGLATFFELLS
jgi:hypothetical protein